MSKFKHVLKKKGLVIASFLVTIISGILISVVPNVLADESIKEVNPGSGTLAKAVAEAQDGDTLKLKAGSYTGVSGDKTVYIDKQIKIVGAGNSKSLVDVPISITTDKEVVLSDFGCGMQVVEPNFIFFKVDSENADLAIKNVVLRGISRGDENGKFPRHEAKIIDVTSKADRAKITVEDSILAKPGVHYGMHVSASNTNITLKNTEIYGRNSILFENGSNNTFTAQDNSLIAGPDIFYTEHENIIFNKQKNLTFTVDNSTIKTAIPYDKEATKTFAFGEGENKSTNVTIDIKNNSKIVDQDLQNSRSDNSVIFDYGSSTVDDKDIVTIDGTSKMYLSLVDGAHHEQSSESLPLSRLYSTVDNAAVIGIYDKDNNGKIQLYANDSEITELSNDKYIKADGYRFKGWFKNFDGKEYTDEYQKIDEAYPKAQSGENMNLYAKLVKLVNVKIGKDDSEADVLESGQTLQDIKDIDEKLQALVEANKTLDGYIMHGETGGEISVTVKPNEIDELKEVEITENVIVEAIHSVTIKVNNQTFNLKVGQKVSDIEDQEAYKDAKLNGRTDKEFSRLVYKKGEETTNETFDEEAPINENVELVTKHNALVTLNEEEYKVEENQKISTNEQLATKMDEIEEAPVESKTFSKFIDSENKKVTKESVINKTTTIKPVYTIKVNIGSKEYTLEEGQKLSSVNDKQDEIKTELETLKNSANGKNFKGFVVSVTDKETKELMDLSSYGNNYDTLVNTILDKELNLNTTIYAEYNAVVTIECEICTKKTFEIDTGKTLEDVAKTYGEDYTKAKYQKYAEDADKEERFARFVIKGEDTEFKETAEIEKSITLTPKYYAYVTIEDERFESLKYKVEQGQTLDDIEGDEAQETLASLRTNIVSDTENLHFEKLVTSADEEIPNPITDDIKIKALYHYDVSIVEDYDNPQNNNETDIHEGTKGFKVPRGQNLSSKEAEVKGALSKLKNSVNNDTRKLASYVEVNSGQEYAEDTLLNTVFNTHIYINAKVAYKVKIGEVEDWVVEGKTIKESENGKLLAALEDIKNVDGQVFANYTINGEDAEVTGDTVINEYTEIGAKYNVKITINNQDFLISKGSKASTSKDIEDINTALNNLRQQTIAEGYNFKGYYYLDGSEKKTFTVDTEVNKNITVLANYNILVTLKGANTTKEFEIESGQTLSDIETQDNANYKAILEKANRTFLHFEDSKHQVINEDYNFTKNIELKAIYAVTVKIGSKDYSLAEDQKLSNDSTIMEALTSLAQVDDKRLKEYNVKFTDEVKADATITLEELNNKTDNKLNNNITITPKYVIDIEIIGPTIFKTTVDEGTKLQDVSYSKPEHFQRFVDYTTNETVEETTELTKHTKLKAIYTIKVNINDHEYDLESFQTFGDIADASADLEALKEVPEGKKSFSRFVYLANGVEVELDEDTVLTSDITVTPKFTIELTIVYPTENGTKEEIVTIELEEGKALKDLSPSELTKLNAKLDEIVKRLEQEGKTNYVFTKFVLNGADVDMQTTTFNEAVTLEAIFEQKAEEAPSEQENTNYPAKEKAPNTGIKEEANNNMSGSIISIIALIAAAFGYKKIYNR